MGFNSGFKGLNDVNTGKRRIYDVSAYEATSSFELGSLERKKTLKIYKM